MSTETARYRFDAGPLDGKLLSPNDSPSIVRCQNLGSYAQDITTGTYRWHPAPIRLDALVCETAIDSRDLPEESPDAPWR